MKWRIFLLSPAQTGGERAQLIFNPNAGFDLARRLHRGDAVSVGEIFSFLSGLYFRGKLAYARKFARPPARMLGCWVITSNRGLLPCDYPITLEELRNFGAVDIHAAEPRYCRPLEQHGRQLLDRLPTTCDLVLLGSVGTRKYADPLLAIFGERLLFPADFVGRGDMSRGGLLLRSVNDDAELEYIPLAGAVRHGPRAPKLVSLRRPNAPAPTLAASASQAGSRRGKSNL